MNKRMNLDEAMRASIGILSDYENNNSDKVEKIASLVTDTQMEKVAGIFIDKPTLENCEDFIKKFMYNELSFFPRILEVNVNLIPSSFNKAIKDHIDVATGVVQIKVRNKVLEVPFMVRDGELDPFDVIQLDGQRAPYSRENLQKIIINLDKQLEMEAQGMGPESESPYAGLEEHVNPSTSPGFMGDVLSIRDSQSMRRGNGMFVTAYEEYSDEEKLAFFGIKKKPSPTSSFVGANNSYVIDGVEADDYEKKASEGENFLGMGLFSKDRRNSLESNLDSAREKVEKEKPTTKAPNGVVEKENHKTPLKSHSNKEAHTVNLNSMLEKTAGLKPMTAEQLEAIAYVFNKKAHTDSKNYLEKLAEEAENDKVTRKEKSQIEKMVDYKFDDVSRMEHGDIIVFPELKNSEFSLTPAIVFKNTSSKFEDESSKSQGFIISIDGRIKMLNGDKFLCKKTPDKKFKLPRTSVGSLETPDRFFIIKEDLVSSPYQVNYVRETKTGWEDNSEKIGKSITATSIAHCNDDISFDKRGRIEINTVEGKKFDILTKEEFLLAKIEETGMEESKIRYSLRGNSNKVVAADLSTQVFKITGTIINFYKSNEELNHETQIHDAGINLDKVAFSLNTINVECCDRQGKLFNLVVEYKDTDARLMNLRRQNFNRIKEGKLKAILRILKFEGNKLTEIIYKAKNEPRCSFPIPASCTIEDIKKIEGGNLTNVSTNAIKGAIGNYVNPTDIAKSVVGGAVAGLAGNAVLAIANNRGASDITRNAFSMLGKFANESKEISCKLEKYAQNIESGYILDMAKVASLAAIYHEKVATVITDDKNIYPDLKEVTKEIVMSRPVLEKMAYDITTLKVNQAINGKDYIDANLVNRAVVNIDTLYKTASNIYKSISKDNLDFKF